MSEFIVHSIPGSPFGRAVLATLEEKGAPYRLSPVAPGTLRSPEHLARHPFGRIPVMEHDGFSLYESQAILRYLDRVLPDPALTPSDPQRVAHMDQVLKKALVIEDPDSLFRNNLVESQSKDEPPAFSDKVEDVPTSDILPQ